MKKRGTYPCGRARVPGITFRPDRAKCWRVRLYQGETTVVADAAFADFNAALDYLTAVRAAPSAPQARDWGALQEMLADGP